VNVRTRRMLLNNEFFVFLRHLVVL
jgi:hypothetical protein